MLAEYHGSMVHAMTVRLPAELYEQLRLVAFDRRQSMNELIVQALDDLLKETG